VPDRVEHRSPFDVTGKAVVVTGGAGGLGSSIARGLAAHGAHLVVAGRAEDRVHEVTSRIGDAGGRAVGVIADVTAPAGREAILEAAMTTYSRLDVLINNAGITHRMPATSITVETYRRVHAINAEAALFLSQAAHPYLKDSGDGSIVNVVSTGLWTGGPQSLLYRSSKAALHAMTMVLAQEWAPDGIRVNAVAPGAFEVGMGAGLDAGRIAAHVARTPQRRRGRGEEIVATMLYLASAASSFVTGTTLRVDGGAVSL
jgi:NAD(P)-dependent dehydrogenase (short-subunit alcohol dehydrogenase family)